MVYLSPELSDALIRSKVRNPLGPAVNDPTGLLAVHTARQAEDINSVRQASQALNMGKKRLDEDARRFTATNDMDKKALDLEKRNNMISSGLATAGLGAKFYTDSQAEKRHAEIMEKRNKLIKDLETIGDNTSLFWSRMLKLL